MAPLSRDLTHLNVRNEPVSNTTTETPMKSCYFISFQGAYDVVTYNVSNALSAQVLKRRKGERIYKRTASRLPKNLFYQLSRPFNLTIPSINLRGSENYFLTVCPKSGTLGPLRSCVSRSLHFDLISHSHGIPSRLPLGPYFLKSPANKLSRSPRYY